MTLPPSMTDTSDKEVTSITVPTKHSSLSDWINYMQQIHVSAIDMGLSRVMPVAHELGLIQSAKQDAYVFTVAGTNGKGSTTAVINEICQQAGYKTALYQSPHMIDFNERIRINGQPADDKTLIDAFWDVEQARLKCELTLSFFEMTTLAAMLIFAQAKCDVWVLEVGLGGRLDVVNIIDPDMTVITNIGIDHVDWLGDTRDKIGFEKAGILRHNVPLVYGEADMPDSIKQRIDELDVPYFQVGQDFDFIESLDNESGAMQTDYWQFSSAHVTLQLPRPALSLINTTNAVATVLASALTVTPTHIVQALNTVKLAGRFDRRALKNRHWLFDVAHNERGVNFLLSQFMPLWTAHKAQYANADLHLVFSMLADKDIKKVVELLTSRLASEHSVLHWHIAEIDHPRASTTDDMTQILEHYNQNKYDTYPSLKACAQGVVNKSKADDLILVCGSFHTIGEVLQTLRPQPLS